MYFLFGLIVSAQENSDNIFNIDNIQKHLKYLGSDLFEGRGTGTLGGELAAKYIALQLSDYGIKPAGDNGTYYQYIPMHGSTPLASSKINVFSSDNNKKIELKYSEDFVFSNFGEKIFTPNPVQLVFVGYGITAPEFEYNDYENLDVAGKIVVFMDGEPISDDENYFAGEYPSVYSLLEAKQRNALSHGAVGSIMIPILSINNENEFAEYEKQYRFEDISLAYSATPHIGIIINPFSAEAIFEGSGITRSDIYLAHLNSRIESRKLITGIKIDGKFKRRDFLAMNIAAMVKGKNSDNNESYIIVSAHYDHLGIGVPADRDSIYNGVLDNAIGTAALLEISRVFQNSKKTEKNILFLFLTGEEKGLLGSKYYVEHPIFPLYKTAANVNIDGIAVFDEFNSIVGFGAEYSSLIDNLERSAIKNNVKLGILPNLFKVSEGFYLSDQLSFARAGIPSILVMDAIDYKNLSYEEGFGKYIKYSKEIYHTPFDDLNQSINFDAVKQHLNILKDLINDISNSPQFPQWNDGVQFKNERLRTNAEKR